MGQIFITILTPKKLLDDEWKGDSLLLMLNLPLLLLLILHIR